MERDPLSMTFYNPEIPQMKGTRNYQRPTLPTNQHPSASMPPQRRQQHVDQTYSYIRMFCGSLCGFGFLILVCMSPMKWVQFLVTKNGLELYTGLWTSCNHELCWSNTHPYYLQFSRVFYLISVLTILIALGWLFSACLPRRGSVITNLDLKVSMLSFTSATCLLLCLILFLAHVHQHNRDVLESNILWSYYLSYCGDSLYVFAGIISFLNHISYRPSYDENASVIPTEKSRLGFGPVTTEEDKDPELEVGFQNEEETPNEKL
ncbi:transmembrane protein 202 [Echinops telfairi]|uniref:Transmembrane protein 202 n=1 Tax=Echinops telfairi TaxID=9371 RepID=A0ABM0J0F4_ECHTE|nr:transmembrane protein 202 [Echinops telfairi]